MSDTPNASRLECIAPESVAPIPGLSHVVVGEGRLIAISGQVGVDSEGKLAGDGGAEAQAHQTFENLRLCLEAAGATFADVLKFTYFVTDMAFMPAVRAARDAHVDTANPPASSAVQVAGLVRPELLLEIEALAVLPR